MLSIKWIRENAEVLQRAANDRGIDFSVRELLDRDRARREVRLELDRVREERNQWTRAAGEQISRGEREEAASIKLQVRAIQPRIKALEEACAQAEEAYREAMLRAPNLLSPDTPIGLTDRDNVELRRVGVPAVWQDFEPLDHVALGELHGLMDIARGVRTAGARQYYLTGTGARLHRAVQQMALDMLEARGFRLLDVPLMVRGETLLNAGFFPHGEDQTYRLADEDRWLVGTSEVPLVSYYAGDVLEGDALPTRLAAASLCFRNEVGSAGRDVRGLYRVHQFAKVEQVVLCKDDPDEGERMLQEITANAEEMLRLLELPYRVVAVCSGDMSFKSYKQYDIETWMPSRGAYGETHSSSLLLDYQARRANIRYRDADGQLRCCWTLNNTAVASPRILIPLLENHQQPDGSIRIPAALRPYLKGLDRLAPPEPPACD
ncbi:serine--tRNA ligase [Cohnella lubricantis]|uniref:Serine--tRNA ligase n=1 Tax=Cohnella lubricantis TaxID=2163172 RepID=A0A841T3Y8_9BACL|nr:serine--tRNA ligase [Cohnella lubricantis]MBB6676293.1 serine--tRNA ligase [Cohnella lubricantis]MBP2117323.1 seryl-tRNA synthetase [Cohnella lubricantis]